MDFAMNPSDSVPAAGPSTALDSSMTGALMSPEAYVASTKELFPSRHIRPQEWEVHRSVIENLHSSGHSMKDIMSHMELSHAFFASESQWKKQLLRWNLRRNLSKGVGRFIGKRALRRQNQQKKKTEFVYRDKQLPREKIEQCVRDLQKQTENGEALSATDDTPEGLTCRTAESPKPSFVTPRNQDQGETPRPPQLENVGPLKMARYEGKDVDQWMGIAAHAASLVSEGRYIEAKSMLLSSLDGLEALLGPETAQTTDLLTFLVEAAVKHGDSTEAANRLYKSYRNHCDNLGRTHVRTWQSLARIGTFHIKEEAQGEAYHELFNARQGLLAAFKDDPEQALNYTHTITDSIVSILRDRNDFSAAEDEIKTAIERTKAAGALHKNKILVLRHALAHLYNNNKWYSIALQGKVPFPTRNGVEPLLLEGISSIGQHKDHINSYQLYLCSLEQLRLFYERTFQHEKLPKLITQIETYLTTSRSSLSEVEFTQSLKSMKGLVLSYKTLKEYGQAEWWLLHRQQQINAAPHLGSTSFEAVTNQMQLADLYHEQQKLNEEQQAMKQAQLIAREALPKDDEFHTYLANRIAGAEIGATRCQTCLVNEARIIKVANPGFQPSADEI